MYWYYDWWTTFILWRRATYALNHMHYGRTNPSYTSHTTIWTTDAHTIYIPIFFLRMPIVWTRQIHQTNRQTSLADPAAFADLYAAHSSSVWLSPSHETHFTCELTSTTTPSLTSSHASTPIISYPPTTQRTSLMISWLVLSQFTSIASTLLDVIMDAIEFWSGNASDVIRDLYEPTKPTEII